MGNYTFLYMILAMRKKSACFENMTEILLNIFNITQDISQLLLS